MPGRFTGRCYACDSDWCSSVQCTLSAHCFYSLRWLVVCGVYDMARECGNTYYYGAYAYCMAPHVPHTAAPMARGARRIEGASFGDSLHVGQGCNSTSTFTHVWVLIRLHVGSGSGGGPPSQHVGLTKSVLGLCIGVPSESASRALSKSPNRQRTGPLYRWSLWRVLAAAVSVSADWLSG